MSYFIQQYTANKTIYTPIKAIIISLDDSLKIMKNQPSELPQQGRLNFFEEITLYEYPIPTECLLQMRTSLDSLIGSRSLSSDQIITVLQNHKPLPPHAQSITDLIEHIISDTHKNISLNYPETQRWNTALQALLSQKELPSQHVWLQQSSQLSLKSEFNSHVQWVYTHIYCHPYSNEELRSQHGIQHVSRVAAYIPVLANLYRKHGDLEANLLTEDDITLLQIAALFHDSARENDGVDQWDHESAIFLYTYLVNVLQINHQKAATVAEAVANKDPLLQGYFKLYTDTNDQVMWEFQTDTKGLNKKNIYQKLLHDADCLDIIRARVVFHAEYLDFYKDIASKPEHPLALKEMAYLITEVRSLIAIQGNTYFAQDYKKKQNYDNHEAYALTKKNIQEQNLRILNTLGERQLAYSSLQTIQLVDNTPHNPTKGFTEQNLHAAAREGKLFSRAVCTPSAISKKHNEFNATKEIFKTTRTRHIATRSKKANRYDKEGNPNRSISMLGFGSIPYRSAGYLIIDPPHRSIKKISAIDISSGLQKKIDAVYPPQNETQTKQELAALLLKLQLGGAVLERKDGAILTHNEIICDLDHYDAIYYSPDDTELPHVGLLEALFLRYEYEKSYQKMRQVFIHTFGEDEGVKYFYARFNQISQLPIIAYSGLHNTICPVPESELTDSHIIHLWVECCRTYMQHQPKQNIIKLTLDEIKVLALYGRTVNYFKRPYGPTDSNYPEHLRQKINLAITTERNIICAAEKNLLLQTLKQYPEQLLSYNKTFFTIIKYHPELIHDPALRPLLETTINMTFPNLFSDDSVKNPPEMEWSLENSFEAIKDIRENNYLTNDLAQNLLKFKFTQKQGITDKITSHPIITNFFKTQLAIYYAICKNLNLNEKANQIRQHAKSVVEEKALSITSRCNEIAEAPVNIPIFQIKMEVIDLVQFIYTFELLDDYQETLYQLTCSVLHALPNMRNLICNSEEDSKTLCQHPSVSDYMHCIVKFNAYQLLTEQHNDIIRKQYEEYIQLKQDDASEEPIETLHRLKLQIEVGQLINFPNRDRYIFNGLPNHSSVSWNRLEDSELHVLKAISLDDNNLDLLNIIINKLQTYRMKNEDELSDNDELLWEECEITDDNFHCDPCLDFQDLLADEIDDDTSTGHSFTMKSY